MVFLWFSYGFQGFYRDFFPGFWFLPEPVKCFTTVPSPWQVKSLRNVSKATGHVIEEMQRHRGRRGHLGWLKLVLKANKYGGILWVKPSEVIAFRPLF
jgi:hypothetical protein